MNFKIYVSDKIKKQKQIRIFTRLYVHYNKQNLCYVD